MELRSCTHFHFILAVKGDSVRKLPNVIRGRPALRFKNVKEIYEAGSSVQYDSVSAFQPKMELGTLQFDPIRVKLESPCLPMAERRTASFQTSEDSEGKGSDLDDFGFSNITLKEIKESCKARKRKFAEYVDVSEETAKNLSPSKQDQIKFESEEDELDLKEPIIRWKSKISKNKKGKRKCMRSHMSTLSKNSMLIVKIEPRPVHQNILQPSGNLFEPTEIKVEVNEPDSSFHCAEQVNSCGVVINESCGTASESFLEPHTSTIFDEEQTSTFSEASCDFMEHADCESASGAEISGWEIVNVDSPEILSYEYPDFAFANVENNLYLRQLVGDVSLESISMPGDHVSDIYYKSQRLSTSHSVSRSSSSDSSAQLRDMVTGNRLQCMKIINGDGGYLFEDDKKEDLPSDVKASGPVISCGSSRGSDSWLDSNTYLVSLSDGSPTAAEQPILSAHENSLRDCSASMHPSDTTDKITASTECEDYHHSEQQSPPERLLSTRKAISPTSQERLCKAMNSIELNRDNYSVCQGKLIFGNQTEKSIIRGEGIKVTRRAEIASNTNQVHRKAKRDKKGSSPNANFKGRHLSRTVPSLTTGCTSIQNLSQSAIAFSQRQMHDIESLASKLTAELSSMKELVKEVVHYDVCSANSLKQTITKVTTTINNVAKAEETAKKWLSIMARDCNRFCKIMKLTEANSTAHENVAHNEKKRITFADEAGGQLCHVKVFENDMDSPLEPTDLEE